MASGAPGAVLPGPGASCCEREYFWSAPHAAPHARAQVQTDMMGDLHHFAWRALHRNQTVYLDRRDAQRFGDWRSEDCDVRSRVCGVHLCVLHGGVCLIFLCMIACLTRCWRFCRTAARLGSLTEYFSCMH
jgi:hypothetical protein